MNYRIASYEAVCRGVAGVDAEKYAATFNTTLAAMQAAAGFPVTGASSSGAASTYSTNVSKMN
jgi:hypothetical protein